MIAAQFVSLCLSTSRPAGAAACLLATVGFSGCRSPVIPPPSSRAVEDSELVAAISLAFRDAGIDLSDAIQIEADGGVVTLRGPVTTRAIGEQLVRVAYSVAGVERVLTSFAIASQGPGAGS